MAAAYGVKARHKTYDSYVNKWRRCRDVVSGQDAIYAGNTLYLSKLEEESDAEYKKRLERTPFYNASWRTIAAFVGMMFRKPPTKEFPARLEPLLQDVTMSGISFDNFAQDITLEDIIISRVGVLVDFPKGPAQNADGTVITLAQAEQAGLRPSMVMYKAEAIINWKHEFINNKQVLTQVRLWEEITEVINEFETKPRGVIRVLDLNNGKYRVRRFYEDNEEQIGWEVYPTMDGEQLSEIPFYFIGPDGAYSELSDPVLIDLIDLNIKHFQVSADYEHGCHMTGLPTPFIRGYKKEMNGEGQLVEPKFYIGSTSILLLPDGVEEVGFLEFQGQGLATLEKNLDRKEAQMAALGARMLTPEKAGVEATETVAMRHSGENSILAAIAVAVSEGLTKALITFAKWAGIDATDKNTKFEINRDFMPFMLSPQAITSLLATVQAGKLSGEQFYTLLQRADVADSEVSWEEEQAKIDSDPSIPKPIPPGQEPPPNNNPQNQPPKGNE